MALLGDVSADIVDPWVHWQTHWGDLGAGYSIRRRVALDNPHRRYHWCSLNFAWCNAND